MEFSISRRHHAILIQLKGELDIHGYEQIASPLHKVVAQRPRGLVIDLSEMTYLASIGISLFIQLAQEVRALGGELHLAEPSDRMAAILKHVNLQSLIKIDATVEEALEKLESREIAALSR